MQSWLKGVWQFHLQLCLIFTIVILILLILIVMISTILRNTNASVIVILSLALTVAVALKPSPVDAGQRPSCSAKQPKLIASQSAKASLKSLHQMHCSSTKIHGARFPSQSRQSKKRAMLFAHHMYMYVLLD